MRKTFIILILFLFYLGKPGYCSVTDPAPNNYAPDLSVNLEDVVPYTLTGLIADMGIDVSSLTPVEVNNYCGNLFLFENNSRGVLIATLAGHQGKGTILILNGLSSEVEQGTIVTYDTEKNIYSAQELSTECIRQISATLQSLVSVVYNCGIAPNPLGCSLDIIDLITNIYLYTIDCKPQE
jgi:hypothetical protein